MNVRELRHTQTSVVRTGEPIHQNDGGNSTGVGKVKIAVGRVSNTQNRTQTRSGLTPLGVKSRQIAHTIGLNIVDIVDVVDHNNKRTR